MSNGINTRQNEEKCVAMLAAQRQLYSEAGNLDLLNTMLLVVLPILISILQRVGEPLSWLTFILYGLSILTIIITSLITKSIKEKKALAASIQLAFDVYVYSMPWDKKLFGTQKDLSADVADKSRKILADASKKVGLKNWYISDVESMTLEDGIFACQKENYHWDVGLRKRYKQLAIIVVTVVSVLIFIIGIINNESIQIFISWFIFVLPVIKWLCSIVMGINDDLERLDKLDGEFSSTGYKSMDDLQLIQKSITEHRKLAVKIPDLIYLIFKDNDEDLAHKTILMDSEN